MTSIPAKRGHKYRAVKTGCRSGHHHPSKKEARRCDELHLLLRAGQISNLEIEPQYWFAINGVAVMHLNGRRVGYKPDFRYIEGGQVVIEDVKGMAVRDFPLRAAIFKALHPEIELRVI